MALAHDSVSIRLVQADVLGRDVPLHLRDFSRFGFNGQAQLRDEVVHLREHVELVEWFHHHGLSSCALIDVGLQLCPHLLAVTLHHLQRGDKRRHVLLSQCGCKAKPHRAVITYLIGGHCTGLKSDKCCFVHWCLSFPCLTQQVVGNTRSQHTTHDQSSSAMIDCTRAWCCMPALPPQFCIPLHTMPRHPPLFPILKTLPFFPQARAHHCRVKLPTGRIPITFSWTAPTIAYRKIYGCLRGSVSRATLLEELAPLIRSMLLRFWGGII